MGSLHVPRLAWPRWARPRRHRGPAALVVAVLATLTVVTSTPHAAYAASGAPYGGTAAAVPGTIYAANYDTGGQGVAYNVTSANGSANSYRSDGVDLEATADTQNASRRRAPTTWAGPRPGSGSTTPSTWRPREPTRVAFRRVLAVRDHRRAAHRQRRRHQPDRLGRRPEHRRLRDLDHRHRQRHPAGRRSRRSPSTRTPTAGTSTT